MNVCSDFEWQYFRNVDKHLNPMADGAKQPRQRKGRSNYAICSKSYLEGKRSAKIKVLTLRLRKHESHTSECFSFFFRRSLGRKLSECACSVLMWYQMLEIKKMNH